MLVCVGHVVALAWWWSGAIIGVGVLLDWRSLSLEVVGRVLRGCGGMVAIYFIIVVTLVVLIVV